MTHRTLQYTFALILCLTAAPVMAQNGSDATPIEITADKSLEWHRNDKQFIARQNAIASQGRTSIAGDTLTANYRETDQSSIDIYEMIAESNVEVKNDTSTAYGDHAIYSVDKQTAVLTGDDLKLISPDQTITAEEKFTYNAKTREATAEKNAFVDRAGDTLKADMITAVFADKDQKSSNDNDENTQGIERMTATGNVVITTPDEVLTGDKAVYTSATNSAEITGKVTIKRGPNMLEGAKATVDLGTNISKMFGSEVTGERVRGVFFPKSQETQTEQTGE